jgi:hypothetical protein
LDLTPDRTGGPNSAVIERGSIVVRGEIASVTPGGPSAAMAYPNPWDAQLAFDGSLVTRWRSWLSE